MTSIVLNSPINPEQLPEVLAQLVRTARRRAHIVINLTPLSPTANTQVNALAAEGQKSVVDELMPFFFMNRDKVEEFLSMATGAEAKNITKMVNQQVAKKVIDRSLPKGDMFEILKREGIYNAGRSTWYDQIDF